MEPEKVPEKLESPINYKIILLILAAAISLQITLMNLDEDLAGSAAFIVSVGASLAVSLASFVIAKRYWSSHVFGKAYLAFALGYFSYFIAEILYYTFDLILGIQAYPSVADVFFFALYPFTLIHLILNIRFFNPKFAIIPKVWIPLIPIVFVFVYSYISIGEFEEPNFDFYYGIIFVLAASTTLSFAIFGATIFKKGVLGVAWLLLLIGIFMNAIGDVWYYHLEIFGEYYDAHPVTVLWYVANIIMIYALYKHIETI